MWVSAVLPFEGNPLPQLFIWTFHQPKKREGQVPKQSLTKIHYVVELVGFRGLIMTVR